MITLSQFSETTSSNILWSIIASFIASEFFDSSLGVNNKNKKATKSSHTSPDVNPSRRDPEKILAQKDIANNSQERGNYQNTEYNKLTGANWSKIENNKIKIDTNSSWQKIRSVVLKRDNFKCTVCRSTSNLTVDHIEELSVGGKNELNNLRTLCSDCHEDRHYRKFLNGDFKSTDDYGENYEPIRKIKKISDAIKKSAKLKIEYIDVNNKKTNRTICPHKISKGYNKDGEIINRNCYYVSAFCEKRNDTRTFRISRIKLID